ncbi:MAG: hypothetical protein AAFO01_05925 [Pseudomonadota bacterium]
MSENFVVQTGRQAPGLAVFRDGIAAALTARLAGPRSRDAFAAEGFRAGQL